MDNLEKYFYTYYDQIIGNQDIFHSPYGKKKILYADWTASGRLYRPIEDKISQQFGPYVANTHTESNITGKLMTIFYHEARQLIKRHLNADDSHILLFEGTGMTGALCKLQRILGLSLHESYKKQFSLSEEDRPVVFITHMEHHSNQTTWEETIADIVIVPPNEDGDVCPHSLERCLEKHKNRKRKIGAFTACSNVTGIQPDYHQLAAIMHKHGGVCFLDFAASAPYIKIDLQPDDPKQKPDAIYFSPHKFLGGPSSTGVVVFSKDLYENMIPDQPGGGTVNWTNPWGGKSYIENIEGREDGGTPGFLQAIRIALSIKLKEMMGIENILARDKELLSLLFERLEEIKRIKILEGHKKERLPIVSFYVEGIHFNLMVKLLNDVHGIQVRGGCACAGTYGHHLLNISKEHSKLITDEVDHGNFYNKPGWVRVSLHPTMKTHEVHEIANGIHDVITNIERYQKDYYYDASSNEFKHRKYETFIMAGGWFDL
ncbi:aminotransferase class V-fold PLP-dependent enzyme [Bacillus sp. AK128]